MELRESILRKQYKSHGDDLKTVKRYTMKMRRRHNFTINLSPWFSQKGKYWPKNTLASCRLELVQTSQQCGMFRCYAKRKKVEAIHQSSSQKACHHKFHTSQLRRDGNYIPPNSPTPITTMIQYQTLEKNSDSYIIYCFRNVHSEISLQSMKTRISEITQSRL